MKWQVYAVGGYQANCYLVWDEQKNAVVIDAGAEPERLLRRVQEEGLSVKALLLTHAHFDHMLAVNALQQATGAPLYLHESEAPALSDPAVSLLSLCSTPCRLTADRVLRDGDTVTAGALTFTALHTAGHTVGSCCYLCDGVLFAGDTLFAGSVGRTDFPGGSYADQSASLRRLAALPPETVVLPGHGEATTIGRECASNPFMIGL